jgi:cytochrome P450
MVAASLPKSDRATPADAAAVARALRRGRNPLATRIETRNGIPVLPGAYPLIGHLPAVIVDELGLMRDAARTVGPVFYFSRGYEDFQIGYTGRDGLSLFKNKRFDSRYMREGRVGVLFGDGLIAHDGAVHQHLRSAMNGPFLPKGLTEAGVGPFVAAIVERRVRSFLGRRRVRVLAETRELALESMFRLVGVEDRELSAWRRHYEQLMLLAIALPAEIPGSPGWFGKRALAWLDARLQAMIAAVRAGGETDGLLPALVNSRDDDGRALTDAELRDNLRLVFLAGHETSATTMAWMVAHLASDPGAWRKLREEALASDGVPRSPKELRNFPYAEGVFRESLRLHPPVSIDARRTTEDLELEGFSLPKGQIVAIPIGLLSRDPDLYPEPDAFRPERWAGRAGGLSPAEMVQFGGGPHFCLGYHLAWMEIVQFAVALARHLPAGGPRLEGAFPAPRYLPLHHPSGRFEARFD